MTASERGVLLLCCPLGGRQPPALSAARFRALERAALALGMGGADPAQDVSPAALARLGCSPEEARRAAALLDRAAQLDAYLRDASERGIFPVTRVSPAYPAPLRRKLGDGCPPVLFCAGDPALLRGPFVGLAGARRLTEAGRAFAARVGRLAAAEGLTLVTGGAVGADTAALEACLGHGGRAVVLAPDDLRRRASMAGPRCLVCSEGGYDLPFSAARALTRNHYIHMLGEATLIAQVGDRRGGTWDGAAENLRRGWSAVYVHDDGSPGAAALIERGATPIPMPATLRGLTPAQGTLL